MSEHPQHRVLIAALDLVLPGDDSFPAASEVALATRLLDHPAFAAAVRAAAERLGNTFLNCDENERLATVALFERDDPALFARFITAAYSGYYSSPAVLEVVESMSGYAARPPQPEGYALPPFDPTLLAVPAARAPHYRTIPEQN